MRIPIDRLIVIKMRDGTVAAIRSAEDHIGCRYAPDPHKGTYKNNGGNGRDSWSLGMSPAPHDISLFVLLIL